MAARTRLFLNREGEGWHLDPVRGRVAQALVGLFGLGLAGAGVAIAGSAWLAAVFLVVIGMAFVGLALPGGRERRDPILIHACVLLPFHPIRTVNLFSLVVVGGTFACAGAGALVEAVTAGPVQQAGWAVAALACGTFLLIAARSAAKAREYPRRGLVLTPDAVVLTQRRPPLSVPWAEVLVVRDHWRRTRFRGSFLTPDDRVDNWLTLERQAGAAVSVNPTQLAVDPYAALDLLRFYLEHADLRRELADSRSLARFEALGLAPVDEPTGG